MRWGMPGPPQFGSAPITNIRNTTTSRYWHRWLKPENRCLVPFTSFCEYADTKPKKTATWFALDDSRPLCAFAGIWTTWHGVPRHEGKAGRGRAPALRVPDNRSERRRRPDPPESDAGATDDGRGMGRLAASAMARGVRAATTAPRRDDEDRGHRRKGGPLRRCAWGSGLASAWLALGRRLLSG